MKNIYLLSCLTFTLFFAKCGWTEEERANYKFECESQAYFVPEPISFTGYIYNEIDTIVVVEKDSLTIIDTLYIYPQKERSQYDISSKRFWGSTSAQFNINHSYEFYIDSGIPYVLDNMAMIVWAQYTMTGEGWGCLMGDYTIDNKLKEDQANINFYKR